MTVTCRRQIPPEQALRDAEILRRWEEKESSVTIAIALGVTRSVVMGVVCRAGKQRREGPVAQREGGLKAVSRQRSDRRIKIRPPLLPPIPPVEFSEDLPPEADVPPSSNRRTILTLAAGECRWPMSDPSSAEFFFCGDPAQAGLSYCGAHCRQAYRPLDAPRDVRPRPRPRQRTGAFR